MTSNNNNGIDAETLESALVAKRLECFYLTLELAEARANERYIREQFASYRKTAEACFTEARKLNRTLVDRNADLLEARAIDALTIRELSRS